MDTETIETHSYRDVHPSEGHMTPGFDRRTILAGAGAMMASGLWRAAGAQTSTFDTRSTLTTAPFVEVETANGRLRGGHSRGALAFKGVPYGGPVDGTNRFKAPPPPPSWTGVRDALVLGPPSLQPPNTTYGENEAAYAENCLVLNVWTPACDGAKRPVMFYNHGGGYATGSAGSRGQDGAHLAATYDVVVVASNHRLGLLGYLYLGELGGEAYATSGNQGLLDIVAALQWVKTNIAAFGGDPDNVMLFGESGGGFKTGTLMAMPAARGLFHKASIESGPGLRRMTKDNATETAKRVLKGLGMAPADLHRLAEVPAQAILDIQLAGEKGPLGLPSGPGAPVIHGRDSAHGASWYSEQPGSFGPVVDGHVLPRHPFDPDATPLAADIPLIIGNNRDEACFFFMGEPAVFALDDAGLAARIKREYGNDAERILSVYRRTRPNATPGELYIAISTAKSMGFDTILIADRKAAQPAPVYRYRCDYESNVPIKGADTTLKAGHATEITLKLLSYDQPGLEGDGPALAPAAHNMSALWASFARTGTPSAPGQPAWPRYDTRDRATMLIDAHCKIVNDPDSEERRLWASLSI
jgi:para-nitrobenzyl esterase